MGARCGQIVDVLNVLNEQILKLAYPPVTPNGVLSNTLIN